MHTNEAVLYLTELDKYEWADNNNTGELLSPSPNKIFTWLMIYVLCSAFNFACVFQDIQMLQSV